MFALCQARFGASGGHCIVNNLAVTQSIQHSLSSQNLLADGAVPALRQAGFRAGGSYRCINDFRMTQCIHNGLGNQDLVTDRAVHAFGNAALRTGGGNRRVNDFRVTQCINHSLGNQNFITDRAVLALRQTGFRTGGIHCVVYDFRMPQCVNHSLSSQNFITGRAVLALCQAGFRTGGIYCIIYDFRMRSHRGQLFIGIFVQIVFLAATASLVPVDHRTGMNRQCIGIDRLIPADISVRRFAVQQPGNFAGSKLFRSFGFCIDLVHGTCESAKLAVQVIAVFHTDRLTHQARNSAGHRCRQFAGVVASADGQHTFMDSGHADQAAHRIVRSACDRAGIAAVCKQTFSGACAVPADNAAHTVTADRAFVGAALQTAPVRLSHNTAHMGVFGTGILLDTRHLACIAAVCESASVQEACDTAGHLADVADHGLIVTVCDLALDCPADDAAGSFRVGADIGICQPEIPDGASRKIAKQAHIFSAGAVVIQAGNAVVVAFKDKLMILIQADRNPSPEGFAFLRCCGAILRHIDSLHQILIDDNICRQFRVEIGRYIIYLLAEPVQLACIADLINTVHQRCHLPFFTADTEAVVIAVAQRVHMIVFVPGTAVAGVAGITRTRAVGRNDLYCSVIMAQRFFGGFPIGFTAVAGVDDVARIFAIGVCGSRFGIAVAGGGNFRLEGQDLAAVGAVGAFRPAGLGTGGIRCRSNRRPVALGAHGLPGNGAAIILHDLFRPGGIVTGIEGRKGVPRECPFSKGRRIALKDDFLHPIIPGEGIIADAGHIFGDREAGRALTAEEGIITDAGDALRDGDLRQIVALVECFVADVGQAFGQGNFRDLLAVPAVAGHLAAAGDGQPGIHQVVDQVLAAPPPTIKGSIRADHIPVSLTAQYRSSHPLFYSPQIGDGQILAVGKGICSNTGDTGRDGYLGQFLAGIECILANASDALRDVDRGEFVTILKCAVTDLRHGFRDHNTFQFAAADKCFFSNTCQAFTERHLRQGRAVRKRKSADCRHTCRKGYFFQARAVIERIGANRSQTGGNRNTGQTGTFIKCAIADGCNTRLHHHTGQATAPGECSISNAGHVPGNRDAGQAGAAIKYTAADTGHILRKRHFGQICAGLKRRNADTGYAVRDHDTGKTAAAGKRIVRDTDNTLRNRYAGQIGACIKRHLADIGKAVGQGCFCELQSVPGRNIIIVRHSAAAGNDQLAVHERIGQILAAFAPGIERTVGADDCLSSFCPVCGRNPLLHGSLVLNDQVGAAAKGIFANGGDTLRDCYTGHATAALKCPIANTDNALRDRYAGQAAAPGECPAANACNCPLNGYAGQRRAAVECAVSNAGNTLRNRHTGHLATDERRFTNTGNTFRYRYIRQFTTIFERAVTDVRNTLRNGYTGQTAAIKKCTFANAGNTAGECNFGQVYEIPERPAFNHGDSI